MTDSLGKKLLAFRTRHQLKQEEFAAILGVSQGTLSRWERDLITDPPPETLQRINSIISPREPAGGELARFRSAVRGAPIPRVLLIGETYILDTRSYFASVEFGEDDRNLQNHSMLACMCEPMREIAVKCGQKAQNGRLVAVSYTGQLFSRESSRARALFHYHAISGQLVVDLLWSYLAVGEQQEESLTLVQIDDILQRGNRALHSGAGG